MASPRSLSNASPSNAEQYGLEKFIRRFFYKCAQVVVQSRQNDKVCTRSSPHPNNEWFSLNINEESEVNRSTKKTWEAAVVSNKTGHFFLQSIPLCVEMSLKTSEGESLVLEQWVFSLRQPEEEESSPNEFSDTVYNRLSMLLKSVVSVSRALPAYKYARNQNCDSYVFMYQVKAHEPTSSALGKEFRSNAIGSVVTSFGVLCLRVDYRTSMTIAPTSSSSFTASPVHAPAAAASHNPASDPITFRQASATAGGGAGFFRPRCPSTSSNRVSDESEEMARPAAGAAAAGAAGGNLTSDDSQDRIFQVDPIVNTPQHQSSERRRKSSFGSGSNTSNTAASTAAEDKDQQQQGEVGQLKFGAFARLSIHDKDSTSTTTSPAKVKKTNEEADALMDLFEVGQDEQPQQQQQQQQQQPQVRKVERKASRSPSNSSMGSREDLRPRTASTSSRRSLGNLIEAAAAGAARTPPRLASPFLPPAASQRRGEGAPAADFEFLELRTPFSARSEAAGGSTDQSLEAAAAAAAHGSDLGVFFKGGVAPPSLDAITESAASVEMERSGGFTVDPGPRTQVPGHLLATSSEAFQTSLVDEISAYESKQAEMDELIKNLETSESESEQW